MNWTGVLSEAWKSAADAAGQYFAIRRAEIVASQQQDRLSNEAIASANSQSAIAGLQAQQVKTIAVVGAVVILGALALKRAG